MMTRYGVDIAARRADDLDKKLLTAVTAAVADGCCPRVLDLGCGSGGLAARLAAAGASTTAVDIADYAAEIAAHNRALPPASPPITFIQAEAGQYLARGTVPTFDFAVLQRMLHYLPYPDARRLLAQLRDRCTQAYLSVTGVESAIGCAHPAAAQPLPDRFRSLPLVAQDTFTITAPLCVYSQTELVGALQSTGWRSIQVWTSAFGNHKVVAA